LFKKKKNLTEMGEKKIAEKKGGCVKPMKGCLKSEKGERFEEEKNILQPGRGGIKKD